jgi:hypothetical protein
LLSRGLNPFDTNFFPGILPIGKESPELLGIAVVSIENISPYFMDFFNGGVNRFSHCHLLSLF